MQITIDKQRLLDCLNKVKHTTANAKVVPILQCFCFKEDLVYGFNGQAGSVTSCPMNGMEFAIHAELFYKIISNMPGDVTLKLTKTRLTISSGSSKTWLGIVPTRGYPEIIPTEYAVFCQASNLVEGLRHVGISIGTNAMKQELLGVMIRGEYIYSSDGKRISRFKLNAPATMDVRLPGAAVDHLIKLGQPNYLALSPQNKMCIAHYEGSNTIYVTTTFLEGFPADACDKILAQRDEQYTVDLPSDIAESVKRVSVLAPIEDADVVVENTDKGLHVRTNTQGIGSSEDFLEWDVKTPFKFTANPIRFLDALEKTKTVDLSDVASTNGQHRALQFVQNGFEHRMALMASRED